MKRKMPGDIVLLLAVLSVWAVLSALLIYGILRG